MDLISKPAEFVPEDNNGISMKECILSIDTDVAYILDEEGFKAEFGDDWSIVRSACVTWFISITGRNCNNLSEEDCIKYYNEITVVAWDRIARSEHLKNRTKEILSKVYKEDSEYLEMISKVLYGSAAKPENGGTLNLKDS